MADDFKLGIVGLDTSHTIAFTERIQGDVPEDQRIAGLRVTGAMRFPSVFQSEDNQDARQAQLEGWGVNVTTSVDEALDGVDGILLELNDPAMHLSYFERVADLGKPVFLDKPLAGNLADGRRIVALAKAKGVPLWSSSALRFFSDIVETCAAVPEPVMCNVYGPLGKAAAGSDLVWYGVHAMEMLVTIMGRGAMAVWTREDARGVVMIVTYADGRRGVVECNRHAWFYGGRVQSAETVRGFEMQSDPNVYHNLLCRLRDFFIDGVVPVDLEDTLEVQAILDAGERALNSGREEGLA